MLTASIEKERARIEKEYARREAEIPRDRYAVWQPAEMLMRTSRRRAAATLLARAGVFPKGDDRCLEVGVGVLGWLPQLVDWGVHEASLSGLDLSDERIEATRSALPAAELFRGDATSLPWADATFHLAIASTLFTSILDSDVRRLAAAEIARVLKKGGALLYYDFMFDNPANRGVKKVSEEEVRALFPALQGSLERVTLAPPIARLVAPWSWALATALEMVPFLRTHLIGVLVKR
jgi:ubiquinone/menaquinone biosynthesis C-methylase UbiE